jgi:hypothetical protein
MTGPSATTPGLIRILRGGSHEQTSATARGRVRPRDEPARDARAQRAHQFDAVFINRWNYQHGYADPTEADMRDAPWR